MNKLHYIYQLSSEEPEVCENIFIYLHVKQILQNIKAITYRGYPVKMALSAMLTHGR